MTAVIIVYAVAGDLSGREVPEGFSVHCVDRVSLLHTESADAPQQTQAEVLAYGRRLNELADAFTVLPMRFGTWVASLEELTVLAERHAEEWARRLEVLDSYCELLVHLTDPPVHDAVLPETGRYYLLGRASALRRSERLRSELRDLVSVWAREGQSLPAPAARSTLLVREARRRRSRARD